MRQLEARLPRYGQKRLFAGFEIGFMAIHVQFLTLGVILLRLELQLPRYRRKRLFADFEIGFTVFAILFLDHCKLFCVDFS